MRSLIRSGDHPASPLEPRLQFLNGRAKRAHQQQGKESGMGLGVFIARTLLEHTGATLDFTNRRRGGASVAVEWNRHSLSGES